MRARTRGNGWTARSGFSRNTRTRLTRFPAPSAPLQQGLALDSDDAVALATGAAAAPPPPHRCAQQPASLADEQLLRVVLPPATYPSVEQLAAHGLYLLEHSSALLLIVGTDCDEELVRDLFGADAPPPAQLPPGTPLPQLNTELSLRIWTIIASLRARRPQYSPGAVLVPADADGRAAAARLFTEDKAAGAPSYVDLLCDLHGAIQRKLQNPS